MLVKPCSASGYQNECKVQAAWSNAFCAVGLHEIGKFTSSISGPSPAPWGAAATVRSARADDNSGSARTAPTAKCIAKRVTNISLSWDDRLRHSVPPRRVWPRSSVACDALPVSPTDAAQNFQNRSPALGHQSRDIPGTKITRRPIRTANRL